MRLGVVSCEEIEYALHNPRGRCLARVDTSRQDHRSLPLQVVIVVMTEVLVIVKVEERTVSNEVMGSCYV